MDFIDLDSENIDKEHICCALSDKKGECQISSKKAWIKNALKDGLVFKKGDVRGKVFIEYIPAENAWCPITAENYMFINCFWVSGKYKGQGIGSKLLDECIKDSIEFTTIIRLLLFYYLNFILQLIHILYFQYQV